MSRLLFCEPWLARRNGIDFDASQLLPVPALAMGVLAALFLEGDHFIGAVLNDDFRSHRGTAYKWCADFAFGRENLGEGDRRARVARKSVNVQDVAGGDSILLAAGADHR